MTDVGEPRMTAERPDLEKIAAEPTGPYAMTHTTETALYALAVEAELVVVRERAERLERVLVELEEMASPSSIEAHVIRRALSAASTQEDE